MQVLRRMFEWSKIMSKWAISQYNRNFFDECGRYPALQRSRAHGIGPDFTRSQFNRSKFHDRMECSVADV
jgi:hypothetical protein